MISWSAVRVTYADRTVLGPLDLAVESGEWVGLIGPNGAGKSTLLKTAVGIVPCEGVVQTGRARRRPGRDLAWMPQRPHLPDEMSVFSYVLLGRTPHLGYFASETTHDLAAVAVAMERLDLATLSERPLATLSGGEAQRAVLARAMAQEAPVLLLDEPTSSLDIGHGIEVMEIIDELRHEDGLTVVSALHDLNLAARFGDRLVLLRDGRIAAQGDPADVLTERLLRESYGPGVRVVVNGDGPTVIPKRTRDVRADTAD